ncbi:MAG: transglycosylase SLT domain-containing protein [Moraxella sp.]|nr:transglycosylase SLT domain-containing protein [Moraxella sp.]
MHCIRKQVLPVHTNQLKQAIFQPAAFAGKHKKTTPFFYTAICPAAHKSTGKSIAIKRILQLLGVMALVLPTKSLTSVPISTFDKVLMTDTFTVAATTSDSTLFNYGDYQHGFGYDVTKAYANYLGTDLQIKTFADKQSALAALQSGQVDAVLSDDSLGSDVDFVNVSCELSIEQQGLSNKTRLNFTSGSNFATNAKNYLCSSDTLDNTAKLAKFYDRTILDDYSQRHFTRAMAERLPKYQATFKRQADKYNHDWHLLAAISYQESQLNPNAVSPTGVRGLMMLTTDTAAAMGVNDRNNATQSIQGGAKYLEQLNSQFDSVPESDRLWFVLAGYNMGPYAVKRIQSELANQGQDPNNWGNFYTYLSNNANKNSRYLQCMHYVKNIRTYLENIKTSGVLNA